MILRRQEVRLTFRYVNVEVQEVREGSSSIRSRLEGLKLATGSKLFTESIAKYRKLINYLCSILQVRRPKGDTLENMGPPLFFRDVEEKYGTKWNFYHRVDVHRSLKELAEDPAAGPGKPATIRLGSQVVDIDCDAGILTLKDGTKHQKDLIVVADGQHVRAPTLLFRTQLT